MSLASASELATALPSIETMMSPPTATWPSSVVPSPFPPRMPAFSAAVPFCTLCTSAPDFDRQVERRQRAVDRQRGQAEVGAAHGPALLERGDLDLAVLIGIAKPMPTLPSPLPPVSICELMPITSPSTFSSGPPELPGLIGASVCSTLSIVKPLGAVISRCSAEITPVVSVRSRSNGLPIA
jgi:hypothetical protein